MAKSSSSSTKITLFWIVGLVAFVIFSSFAGGPYFSFGFNAWIELMNMNNRKIFNFVKPFIFLYDFYFIFLFFHLLYIKKLKK